MSKNNNKNSKPAATNKPADKTPKPQTAAKADVKKDVEEIIVPEVEDATPAAKKETGMIRIGMGTHNSSRMSAGDKVKLAYLMHERWEQNPNETVAQYGHEFLLEVKENIDTMTILALADARQECLDAGIPLYARGTGKELLALNVACEIFGIQLPKAQTKMLESNLDKEVEVNVTEASILDATDKAIKDDRETRKEFVEALPNLDPTKVVDDADLGKTLNYMLTKQGPNMAQNIINGINFIKEYRILVAKTDEEKAALEARAAGEWVEDILTVAKPSAVVNGIVKTVGGLLTKYGNPVMAHCTLTAQLKGKDAVCPVSDEDVVSLMKTFVKIAHKYSLPSVGADGKEVKEDLFDTKAVKALTNGSESVIEEIMTLKEPNHKGPFYRAIEVFYGINTKNMNLYANVNFKDLARTKMGQIMNLYLPAENKMQTYSGLPSAITEFPQRTVLSPAEIAEKKAAEGAEKKN